MRPIVAKFGGTSLATADQFRKVAEIVRADARRRFIVVSAPGKRNPSDVKITDLLLGCAGHGSLADRSKNVPIIRERFEKIVSDLGVGTNVEETMRCIEDGPWPECYLASRGEYLSARIMADLLDAQFVDAADFIAFRSDGTLDMAETKRRAASFKRSERRVVIPGFYGVTPNGQVKTFPRGGSDITGSIVATVVGAEVYENWTDVPGILTADPKVVPDAHPIASLTRSEVRELSLRGADVLHPEVVRPLRETDTRINIRSTNDPKHPGTMIYPAYGLSAREPGSIVGIAGRIGFSTITIGKFGIDEELGFVESVGKIFREHEIPIVRIVDGTDTVSVTVRSENLDYAERHLLRQLRDTCGADTVEVIRPLAIVAIVGAAMANVPGVLAKAAHAIAESGVSIRSVSQDPNERSILFVVNEADHASAVRSLHQVFHP